LESEADSLGPVVEQLFHFILNLGIAEQLNDVLVESVDVELALGVLAKACIRAESKTSLLREVA
jgi:hypothetical protein